MIKWVALTLPFLVSTAGARSAWAAWEPVHSALVGTSVAAVAAVVAALFAVMALKRLRQKSASERAHQLSARGTLDTALQHGGISAIHWQGGKFNEAYGEAHDMEGLRAFLDERSRTTLDTAVNDLHTLGTSFQVALTAADGEKSFEAMGFASGNQHTTMIVRDDTAGRAAQMSLENEARTLTSEAANLRTTLDAFDLPIWRRDQGKNLIWCNPAYTKAVDAEPAAVFENGGIELVHSVPRDVAQALSRDAFEKNTAQHTRHHVVIDGQRRLFEITEAPDPERRATIGWATDITEVERAEQDLERHTEAHAEVLEALNTSIAI